MNKGELIEVVAVTLNQSRAEAGRVVEAVLEGILNGIKRDDGVTLTGFGTFTKKDRAPRMGRNPSTGAPIEIKAGCTVGFRPSQAMKDALAPARSPSHV